jgi:hypothetical protein
MGFLERLFCSHNYICVRNFTAEDGYLSSAWRCEYCGKETTKRGQHKVYVSTQVATPRKSHYSSKHNSDISDNNSRNNDFINPLNPISPNYIGNHSILSSKHTDDCQPSHSHDYGSSSHSSSDSCSSSSDSSSGSSSTD